MESISEVRSSVNPQWLRMQNAPVIPSRGLNYRQQEVLDLFFTRLREAGQDALTPEQAFELPEDCGARRVLPTLASKGYLLRDGETYALMPWVVA